MGLVSEFKSFLRLLTEIRDLLAERGA